MDDYANALADGVEAALPGWVERSVHRVMEAWAGAVPSTVASEAAQAGRQAAGEVGGRIRRLLELDIDEQRETPLTILREAVGFPAEVLRHAGVPPIERDRFSEERFPDDDYDLTPASFADIDESLVPLGLAWGASKAKAHAVRHGDGAR